MCYCAASSESLGPLKNGDSVLFNSKVFTAQVNFTLRTSFVFLPEDGHCFIDRTTGAALNLDYFDVDDWRRYGLSPVVSDLPTGAPAKAGIVQVDGVAVAAGSDNPPLKKEAALEYLERVLADTKAFRAGLAYRKDLKDQYPPMTVIYSKTTPTVRGALVDGYEGIKRPDPYEDLVFGAGDGVCLARAAMLPPGYTCAQKVAVDRGHLSLLGELEAVGKCVQAIVKERGW